MGMFLHISIAKSFCLLNKKKSCKREPGAVKKGSTNIIVFQVYYCDILLTNQVNRQAESYVKH